MSGNIQYLSNDKIDKVKWDQCIDKADNGLIYAYSFYLDAMAENWDALVLDDYEAVMPLTWKKKYGIHYLYQPFLTAQLGLFGSSINAELVEKFLGSVPAKFKYIDIYLNRHNFFPLEQFKLYPRSNYVLDLNKKYDYLYSKYRENIQRNIKKAMQAGCSIQKRFDIVKVIELALKQMKRHSKESGENVNRFRNLYQLLDPQKKALTYGVSLKDELLASAVFFFSHNRAYYILVGNNPNGKNIGASHALIDAFIKDHAGRDLVLDFEGSDLPNLAFFYNSFGAVEEKYAGFKLNRLPFYLKWLKK
ncbi:MAG: GNAT family N-acetyltransferase [Chitinophagaceae bacterium]|nr:GNAT family N-acetyltransferase [Chitinophagaceae bacterium]